MPNRPGRNRVFNTYYDPPRTAQTGQFEILPSLSAAVNQSVPAAAQSPAASFGSTVGNARYFALFRFDLRGLRNGLISIQKALLIGDFGGAANFDNDTFKIGVVNDTDAQNWTAAATWNTKDGAVAWTGGAGGFRQTGTEQEFKFGQMPGAQAGEVIDPTTGQFVNNHACYNPEDSTLTQAHATAIASVLNSAMQSHSGIINIYIVSTEDNTTAQALQGDLLKKSFERVSLYITESIFNTGLAYFGPSDAASLLFPSQNDYATAHADNAGVLGWPYFDMTTVDNTNATVRGYNYHGGSVTPTADPYYGCTITAATGASVSYILMHFNLSSFIGKTFRKVMLRVCGGATGGGAGVAAGQLFVGMTKDGWSVGDGGGATSTKGPTFNHQEKQGSVAWPSGFTPAEAGFLDTTPQAETAFTIVGGGFWNASLVDAVAEADITAMANHALTQDDGNLWLRIRCTNNPTPAGPTPNVMRGPTQWPVLDQTVRQHRVANNSVASGIAMFPRLVISTEAP
jgi:hypothetical protein